MANYMLLTCNGTEYILSFQKVRVVPQPGYTRKARLKLCRRCESSGANSISDAKGHK